MLQIALGIVLAILILAFLPELIGIALFAFAVCVLIVGAVFVYQLFAPNALEFVAGALSVIALLGPPLVLIGFYEWRVSRKNANSQLRQPTKYQYDVERAWASACSLLVTVSGWVLSLGVYELVTNGNAGIFVTFALLFCVICCLLYSRVLRKEVACPMFRLRTSNRENS